MQNATKSVINKSEFRASKFNTSGTAVLNTQTDGPWSEYAFRRTVRRPIRVEEITKSYNKVQDTIMAQQRSTVRPHHYKGDVQDTTMAQQRSTVRPHHYKGDVQDTTMAQQRSTVRPHHYIGDVQGAAADCDFYHALTIKLNGRDIEQVDAWRHEYSVSWEHHIDTICSNISTRLYDSTILGLYIVLPPINFCSDSFVSKSVLRVHSWTSLRHLFSYSLNCSESLF